MNIIKVTKKTYKVIDAIKKPFMNFKKFREIRENHNMKVEKTCFNCHKKFMDDDDIYLVITSGGNKLLCGKCNDIVLKDLEEKGE